MINFHANQARGVRALRTIFLSVAKKKKKDFNQSQELMLSTSSETENHSYGDSHRSRTFRSRNCGKYTLNSRLA